MYIYRALGRDFVTPEMTHTIQILKWVRAAAADPDDKDRWYGVMDLTGGWSHVTSSGPPSLSDFFQYGLMEVVINITCFIWHILLL